METFFVKQFLGSCAAFATHAKFETVTDVDARTFTELANRAATFARSNIAAQSSGVHFATGESWLNVKRSSKSG